MDDERHIEARRIYGIEHMIRQLGDDPTREGLRDTPRRVIKAWQEMCAGYKQNPADVLTLFDAERYDEMICVGPVKFYSTCEHHLLPFFGQAWVAYIPRGRIVGLSKLPRLVEIYARRLQNQERLTQQIAQGLEELVSPQGVACLVTAQHFCMMARGVRQQEAAMTTSCLRGAFLDDNKARSEFFALTRRTNNG